MMPYEGWLDQQSKRTGWNVDGWLDPDTLEAPADGFGRYDLMPGSATGGVAKGPVNNNPVITIGGSSSGGANNALIIGAVVIAALIVFFRK